MSTYSKAPITEAVIEFRWASPLTREQIVKIRRRMEARYPFEEETNTISVQIATGSPGATPAVSTKTEFQAFKLTSVEANDILLLGSRSFARSKLPPYCGWKIFFDSVREDWFEFTRQCDPGPLSRVGVRYINRVDIPFDGSSIIRNEDYFNIYPTVPGQANTVHFFSMNVILPPDPSSGSMVRVQTATTDSPIIDHASFLLDLDIFMDTNLPARPDDIWKLVQSMGEFKTAVFEMLVTEKARKLFE